MPESSKNWEETWANAFEEGFYDNVDGAEDPDKKALLVETDAQGRSRVVGVATGAEAERMIAEAQASGVEVRQNAAQVEDLMLREQSTATDVPPEIYDLMSTLMSFAQELGQEWSARGSETLPRPGRLATEVEYSHEDITP
jgi:type III secretion system FlhB-like substrate exporter